MAPIRPNPLAVIGLAAALALGGCGGDADPSAACRPIEDEPLDPSWTIHLLPGATEPEYQTDPPTSGPHLAGSAPEGIQSEPLDRPSQVSVLEVGGVLVQYRPGALDGQARGRLERLAGPGVVVAPQPSLPDPVTATAWLRKRSCAGADIEALTRFAKDEGGAGPASG